MDLLQLLTSDRRDIISVSKAFGALLDDAVIELNENFSIKRLSKSPREIELLPTDTRQLSSYRTRIGTMLEYAMSTAIAKILHDKYGDELFFTFAVSHQYPDFLLRDKNLKTILRVEMKAVDADSDEQAARFDAPTDLIQPTNDLLLMIGWQWKHIKRPSGDVIGECPHIFASLVLPAGEIAKERDERLKITGGKIEDGKVYVYSKKKGEFVLDPGNYGKFWRIIHSSRMQAGGHTEILMTFVKFLEEIAKHSPKNRFVKEIIIAD